MDVAGLEPAAPCLQSKRKFNLSRCFGCAYEFEARLRSLQSCSNTAHEVAGNSRWLFWQQKLLQSPVSHCMVSVWRE